jgi:hypothetical protein
MRTATNKRVGLFGCGHFPATEMLGRKKYWEKVNPIMVGDNSVAM